MNQWIMVLVTVVFMVLLYLVMNRYYRQLTAELTDKLYREMDPDGYLAILNSTRCKFFLSAKIRTLMAVDAYMLKQDSQKIQECFDFLEKKKLNGMTQIGLYQKELTFYVDMQEYGKAKYAYERLMTLTEKLKAPEIVNLRQECEFLYEIYVNHNTDYYDRMIEMSNSTASGFYSGIYLYRAAKLQYFKKDLKAAEKLLKQAQEKVKGSEWEKLIGHILDGNMDILEIK